MQDDRSALDRVRQAVARAGRRISQAREEHLARGQSSAPAPFVVGVGRSGTTLLRLILDAHPQLSLPPETGFLIPFLARGHGAMPGSREELLATVTGFHTWPDFGITTGEYERGLARIEPYDPAEGVRLFYRLYAARHGKALWGDKTPAYGPYLEGLHRLLPEARFVHIFRDGRDVALSLSQVWFAPARDAAGLGRFWEQRFTEIRRAGRRVPHYLEVRYEDLVLAPRRTLEAICSFLDLPYHPALEAHSQGAARRLAEVADQRLPDGRIIRRETRLFQQRHAVSPLDASLIGRFRREMTLRERRELEGVAGRLLFELGYEI